MTPNGVVPRGARMTGNEDGFQFTYRTLRVLIGLLGVTLPLLLVLGTWFQPSTSISDYYYTNMRDYFEGVLFFLTVFLFAYRPYRKEGLSDILITGFSACCALLLALFPTFNETLKHVPQGLTLNFVTGPVSGLLHNIGSGGLFVAFSVLSLFVFTRGSSGTPQKRVRNVLFIVFGVGILVCIGIVGWGAWTAPDQKARDLMNIFGPETSALVLFGLSWLVKGGAFPFLNDRN